MAFNIPTFESSSGGSNVLSVSISSADAGGNKHAVAAPAPAMAAESVMFGGLLSVPADDADGAISISHSDVDLSDPIREVERAFKINPASGRPMSKTRTKSESRPIGSEQHANYVPDRTSSWTGWSEHGSRWSNPTFNWLSSGLSMWIGVHE